MSALRRIVLVRHGETDGQSSIRFHGSGDVPLSDSGRAHMREISRGLAREVFDLVVASPLARAWESARILSGGAPVRIESDFREIDFGRWEGLTKQEIELADPVLYADWQARVAGFEFPGGEPRTDFRARVLRGLERLEQSGARSALVVAHKGVVRTVAEKLGGDPLPDDQPPLGGVVGLSRGADGVWRLGRRGSNPPGLA
jgi:broad specificity phosphatase PhoE